MCVWLCVFLLQVWGRVSALNLGKGLWKSECESHSLERWRWTVFETTAAGTVSITFCSPCFLSKSFDFPRGRLDKIRFKLISDDIALGDPGYSPQSQFLEFFFHAIPDVPSGKPRLLYGKSSCSLNLNKYLVYNWSTFDTYMIVYAISINTTQSQQSLRWTRSPLPSRTRIPSLPGHLDGAKLPQIAPNCPSSNRSSDDKSLDLGCYPFFQSNSKTKLSSCRMLQVISSLNLFMQFYIYIYMYDVFMHYIIIYLHTYITYHYMTVCLVTSTLFVLKSPFFLALFTFNRFHRWIGVRENLQEISWNFPWNMRFLDTFPWTRPLNSIAQ
jgi:hypothetical protein